MCARIAFRELWVGIAMLTATASVMSVPPDDPDFPRQWNLLNTGQTIQNETGVVGADIGAIDAWKMHQGTRPVTIAIVGRGVDPHIELGDRLLEGIATTGDLRDSRGDCGSDTALAGLMAAEIGNDLGMAGLNDAVRILPVRATSDCVATARSTADGINWAVNQQADIILVPLRLLQTSSALNAAVANAVANDILVVAPLGNSGDALPVYPAAIDGCMAIGATTNRDTVHAESNASDIVDLAAPGYPIWSLGSSNGFEYFPSDRGTTIAAAHVAGAASLLISYAPHLASQTIAQNLVNGAVDLAPPGWDQHSGFGRLNVASAIRQTEAPAMRFEPVDPFPTHISSTRATAFVIRVMSVGQTLDPDSVELFSRVDNGPFEASPLISLGQDRYLVLLPPAPCANRCDYYLEASSIRGTSVSDPPAAPTQYWSATSIHERTLFADDFETDRGWIIEGGDIRSGRWTREEPIATSAQPEYDRSFDEGSLCLITGQHVEGQSAGLNDVDGGPVIITSPVVVIETDNARVGYARWFQSQGAGTPDALTVEISGDGGQSWFVAETVNSSAVPEWIEHSFALNDLPGFSGRQLQLRFSTSDAPNDSLTEAAIDDVFIEELRCALPIGDVTGDGATDLEDFQAYFPCLTGPAEPLTSGNCFALDSDEDLQIDMSDFQQFQASFSPR